MDQAGIADIGAREIELGEIAEALKMRKPVVRDIGMREVESM